MINFETADKAREYISYFVEMWEQISGLRTTNVTLEGGREIHFDCMTDEDAMTVAHGLWHMEQTATKDRSKQ